MVNSDILGRLRNLKIDVENSPEFSQTATSRSKAIVDSVLNTFLRVGGNAQMGFGNVGNNILSNLGINNGAVKSRLTILTNIDTLKGRINLNRELTPSMKNFAVAKLDLIKRMR